MDTFFKNENGTTRNVIVGRYCSTNGMVTDYPLPQICNDEECSSCRMFDNMLKEETSAFKTTDGTFKTTDNEK